MSPLVAAWLRRHWPLTGAIAVLVLFTVVHLAFFEPAAARYRTTLRLATEMGMPLEPEQTPPVLPPRVFALLSDNALPGATVLERANSGTLVSELLEDVTRIGGRHDLQVVLTEPGTATQLPGSTQVRAHLHLRGNFAGFVAFLDELAAGGRLFAVDRFTISSQETGHELFEIWISRLILKQPGGQR